MFAKYRKTLDYDPEMLVGRTIDIATQMAQINGFKLIIKERDEYMPVDWLSNPIPENTIYATQQGGRIKTILTFR